MVLYLTDRQWNITLIPTTNLDSECVIISDLKTEEVSSGASSFELTFTFSKETREKVENACAVGNYILKQTNGKAEFYTIIDAEENTFSQTIKVYAEDAGLDLLNEQVGAYKAEKIMTFAEYAELLLKDTGFEIGINEITNLNRTLEWTGEATKLARLNSLATQFDNSELSFSFSVNGMKVEKLYINVYKQRGKDIGKELRVGRDINRITKKQSIANLATALEVTGKTVEGSDEAVTLKGYSYDDGDIYIDGTRLLSRTALQKWGRANAKDKHITKLYSYDTDSQSELCAHAVTKLKELRETELTLDIDIVKLPDNIAIGDRINIVDDAGEFYISSRILTLKTSEVSGTTTAELGDYVQKESGISAQVEALATKFNELAKNRTLYTWVAFADDKYGNGISLSPEEKSYLGIATNRVVKQVDISNPSIFSWIKAEGKDGQSIQGKDGKSAYLHLAYADSEDGREGFTFTQGLFSAYIGQYADENAEASVDYRKYTWSRWRGNDGKTTYVHIAYANSIDGSVDFSTTDGEGKSYIGQYTDYTEESSTNASDYTWSLIKGADGKTPIKGVDYFDGDKGDKGDKGDNGISVRVVTPYYYLSTSNETQEDGSWELSPVDYIQGRYYWLKYVTTYTDNTTTESTPIIDETINKVYEVDSSLDQATIELQNAIQTNIDNAIETVNNSWSSAIEATNGTINEIQRNLITAITLSDGTYLKNFLEWSANNGLTVRATNDTEAVNPSRVTVGGTGIQLFAEGATTAGAIITVDGTVMPIANILRLQITPYELYYDASDDTLTHGRS